MEIKKIVAYTVDKTTDFIEELLQYADSLGIPRNPLIHSTAKSLMETVDKIDWDLYELANNNETVTEKTAKKESVVLPLATFAGDITEQIVVLADKYELDRDQTAREIIDCLDFIFTLGSLEHYKTKERLQSI